MVEVNDFLVHAPRTTVDPLVLLSRSVGEAVEAEEKAVLGLKDVLFRFVSICAAQADKVRGVSNRYGDGCCCLVRNMLRQARGNGGRMGRED